jgi:hypothetical protein
MLLSRVHRSRVLNGDGLVAVVDGKLHLRMRTPPLILSLAVSEVEYSNEFHRPHDRVAIAVINL